MKKQRDRRGKKKRTNTSTLTNEKIRSPNAVILIFKRNVHHLPAPGPIICKSGRGKMKNTNERIARFLKITQLRLLSVVVDI